MSRAEVCWRSSGRPCGLTKRLSRMPRRWAAAFIMSAKPSTEPPTPSAMVTATSLADLTMMILRALSSVISMPGGKPILDGGIDCASSDTVRGVSSAILPVLTALSAT